MDAGHSAKNGEILDMDMSGESCVIAHDHVVSDDAIVGYMRIGEEIVAVADYRKVAVIGRRMDRGKFTENILIADFQTRFAAGVFQILRFEADACVRTKFAISPERLETIDGGVMVYMAAVAERHFATDKCIRSDNAVGTDFCALFDDRGRVNFRCLRACSWLVFLHELLKKTSLTRIG